METPTLQQLSKIFEVPSKVILPKYVPFRNKLASGILLLISDIITIGMAMLISLYVRNLIFQDQANAMPFQLNILPYLVIIFPIGFYLKRLYPGFGLHAVEELRTLSYTITLLYAVLATVAFLFKFEIEKYSRFLLVLSWALTLPLVPLGRAFVRKCFSNKDWWGIPVMIIGAGKVGKELIKSLIKNPNLGYKPAVAIDNDVDNWGYANNIPIVGDFKVIPEIAKNLNIQHAIFAMPEENSKKQNEFIKKYTKYFAHTYFIPDYFIGSQLWVSSFNLGGILGMEVRQRLLNPSAIVKKRIFDLLCTIILSIVVLPVFLLISILILIDSPGKIFFYQDRVGVNGTRFKVFKFRTMYKDAEERLHNLITHDKKIKEEYELYHKLKNDPRVTKIGKILRKFSLDELPQLWNIFRGDMSLIGPRAMMPWEQFQINGHRNLILQVKPGLTGLWQVTDRNDTTFEERIPINIYYIRNWSIFLDIHILAKTVSVVLLGKGGN